LEIAWKSHAEWRSFQAVSGRNWPKSDDTLSCTCETSVTFVVTIDMLSQTRGFALPDVFRQDGPRPKHWRVSNSPSHFWWHFSIGNRGCAVVQSSEMSSGDRVESDVKECRGEGCFAWFCCPSANRHSSAQTHAVWIHLQVSYFSFSTIVWPTLSRFSPFPSSDTSCWDQLPIPSPVHCWILVLRSTISFFSDGHVSAISRLFLKRDNGENASIEQIMSEVHWTFHVEVASTFGLWKVWREQMKNPDPHFWGLFAIIMFLLVGEWSWRRSIQIYELWGWLSHFIEAFFHLMNSVQWPRIERFRWSVNWEDAWE
jgi:hypothetical protein